MLSLTEDVKLRWYPHRTQPVVDPHTPHRRMGIGISMQEAYRRRLIVKSKDWINLKFKWIALLPVGSIEILAV